MAKRAVDAKIVKTKSGVGFTKSQEADIEASLREHIADGTAPQPLAKDTKDFNPEGERNIEKHVRLTASPDGAVEEARINEEIDMDRGRNKRDVLKKSKLSKQKDSERRVELVVRFVLQNWALGHIMRMAYELWGTTPGTTKTLVKRARNRIKQLSQRHTANALVQAVGFETAMMRVWWDDFDKTRSEVERFKAELLKTHDEIFRLQSQLHMLSEGESSKLVALTGRAKFLESQVDKGQHLKIAFSREATSHRRRLDELAGFNEGVAGAESGKMSGPGISTPAIHSQKTADEAIADLFSVVATRMVTYGHEPPVAEAPAPVAEEKKSGGAADEVGRSGSGKSDSQPEGQVEGKGISGGVAGLSWQSP
jgi:hypothetical protein